MFYHGLSSSEKARLLNQRQFVNRNSEMKMCPKFRSLLFLIWTFEVNSQILSYPGLNGGCTGCPATAQSIYVNYPWYPQSRQVIYQYPVTGQYYQQYMPYVYVNNQPQPASSQQLYPNLGSDQITSGSRVIEVPTRKTTDDSKVKYGNVKTEIIDIDPQSFRYLYSSYLPNVVPRPRKASVRKDLPYVVKVDSNQYNTTSIPQVIKKHDVQHKISSFRKTFVLKPGDKDSVINLNFVNGEPVTTETSDDLVPETTQLSPVTTTEEPVITTEEPTTTTENDTPVSLNGWFI